MPNINDRIGSQNIIRVLSNASSPPTRLINLSDVNSTLKTQDGMILVWDLPSESFIMTSVIDRSLSILGIVEFDNTTQSTLPTNGALVVSGGVGIGKNLNIGGSVTISGAATFASNLDINAAVDILNGLNVNSTFQSVGVTTLSSSGGITTTGGDLYIEGDLYVKGNQIVRDISLEDIYVTGVSTYLGTTNIGDNATIDKLTINAATNVTGVATFNNRVVLQNNLTVSGITTLSSSGGITTTGGDLYIGGDLYVSDDLIFDEFTARNGNITGIATIGTLRVTGSSLFNDNVSISGFVTVTDGIYYGFGDYDGPNGIAYFNNTGKLIGAASTESSISTTNYILSVDSNGIPIWSSIIDGGEY